MFRSAFWRRLQFAVMTCATLGGGVWVLNLPYPMIRHPVAQHMPLVLLPSFMSMDHNYRLAIANTEQADQLVNQATSTADFGLGETKVKAAQKNLDALPVWFLGYYPSAYCSWVACSWRFTLDEFQQARKNVARMEARLFQEKNAQTELEKADLATGNAKQDYQEAPNQGEKEAAIARWQQAMDQLQQIPQETLAGRNAQTKLSAYDRDFQQVVGYSRDNRRVGNLIQAAKFSAEAAQTFSGKTAQSVIQWEQAKKLWQDAIDKLDLIKDDAPDYSQAQKLRAQYQVSLAKVKVRATEEQESAVAYNAAQTLKSSLFDSVQPGSQYLTPDQITQLQKITIELQKVKPNTTVHPQAQELLKAALLRLPK
jgi:hypothetical protein